jgi:hypothetical protein
VLYVGFLVMLVYQEGLGQTVHGIQVTASTCICSMAVIFGHTLVVTYLV